MPEVMSISQTSEYVDTFDEKEHQGNQLKGKYKFGRTNDYLEEEEEQEVEVQEESIRMN